MYICIYVYVIYIYIQHCGGHMLFIYTHIYIYSAVLLFLETTYIYSAVLRFQIVQSQRPEITEEMKGSAKELCVLYDTGHA